MFITCSTLLSLFHEDTLKYAEDRGVYTAPCELQEWQRLQLWIPTPITPRCSSIRKLGYVIECQKVSSIKMFLLK